MARDPLRALAKLRRLAVDAAKQDLARCEQYRAALDSHIRACEQAIIDNEPTRSDCESRTAPIAALHAYVDKLQRRSALLRKHVPIADMKTNAARQALSLSRLAERTVEEVSHKREQAMQAEAERRAQQALDDVARTLQPLFREKP